MAKKCSLILVLTTFVVGGVFAQETGGFNSLPPVLKKGNILVNAGVGFGAAVAGDTVIPPIQASVDYVPGLSVPLSFGGFFALSTSEQKYSLLSKDYGYRYTITAFGARVGYHPNFNVKNLDAYANLSLGWWMYEGKFFGDEALESLYGNTGLKVSTFYYGIGVGARYFFTKNIGAFAELGYSALGYATAGLALKF